ncbi:uncharacterized protein LOC128765342 [Synchiropus splendidus]|uniref:uncharacterized protein LOC128765341 n=1 Tax=Synchiropus splendidus TaxID=270530 RepID=UPI00237E40F8|nr:uncharacterized protein LOC128765341 [Synchiropus splendidus]XP_053732003.1 uncharacterized protein LOC128765342 [Synchiropus splendidus]
MVNLNLIPVSGPEEEVASTSISAAAGPVEEMASTSSALEMVCLQSQQICGRCSEPGSSVHSGASGLPGTYARILFVDFSSAFNTILPALLEDKLCQLNVPESLCRWITDFLTSRSHHQSVKLIKFADETTIIGLFSDEDESANRREVERLVSWCSHNNLELNVQKTVEMIMDFRRVTGSLSPLLLAGLPIPIVDSFCFLGGPQMGANHRVPHQDGQKEIVLLAEATKMRLLVEFYTAIIQSILTSSYTIWYNSATSKDKSRLQRIMRSAEKVISCSLPPIQDLYVSRTQRRAGQIRDDPSQPGHGLFVPLPSDRRPWSIQTEPPFTRTASSPRPSDC